MHKLKFAYQTLCWSTFHHKRFKVEEVVREVKDAGFGAIEFAEQLQHFARVPDFPKFMREEGMTMASLSSGVSYNPGDTCEESVKRAQYGAQFGVTELMLCGGWGSLASTKAEDLFDNLATNLDNLAWRLEPLGIIPAFHPHLDTLVETREDTERLLCKMNRAGLCLDFAHFSVAGSDATQFYNDYSDRIVMIHIKDWEDSQSIETCGKAGRFCELGEGRLDLLPFLDALRDRKFPGWIVIELDDTTRTPLESAKISHNYLKNKGYI